jgi:AAA15 family ATPase/GTPase
MIIKFSFQNVLSFSKRQELSLKASAKHERLFDDRANSMDSGKDFKVLRSGVLYGANASGKSNFVKVFAQFQQFVLTGNQNFDGQEIRVPSFQLADEFANKPAVFEMECFWGGKLYRYGLRIKRKNGFM